MNFWMTGIIVFVLIDILIVAYVVWKRNSLDFSDAEKRKFRSHWKRIVENRDFRHALMDADKLLDIGLKGKRYEGSLGEKLQQSSSLFSDLNGVWAAHKLRNRLAHEIDAKLSEHEARRALRQFERALKDLGML